MKTTESDKIDEQYSLIRSGMLENRAVRKTVRARAKAAVKHGPANIKDLQATFDRLVESGFCDINIGFWRVSDTKQAAEDTWGPESQMQAITAWAVANTDRGIDMWVWDIESGTHESRAGLDIVRSFVATGHVKRVISYRYDRLARSAFLAEQVDREFATTKCKWISATEDLPEGAVGRLMKQIIMALAQYEAALISQRLSGGKRSSIQRNGVYAGGEVPYGYLAKGMRGDSGKGVLIICDVEAEVIRLIFMLYELGYSQSAIAMFLNRKNIPTRHGGHLGWRQGQIRRIVRHEAAYRSEALFSHQFTNPDVIAHAPILPTRPKDERFYCFGNVQQLPWGTQVPDDVTGEPLPQSARSNSIHNLTEHQAKTILALFSLRDQGISQWGCASRMNEYGLTTLEGRQWQQSTIHIYLARRRNYEEAISRLRITLDADWESFCFGSGWDSKTSESDMELAAIERMKSLRAAGMSIAKIVMKLQDEGYTTSNGCKWHPSTVDRVLKGYTRRSEVAV